MQLEVALRGQERRDENNKNPQMSIGTKKIKEPSFGKGKIYRTGKSCLSQTTSVNRCVE